MRFDSITADAFGPFRNDELVLGPRLTVVHGLNESGKSSWAAALYASLAGRRRSRGRGSKEDAQFRSRHKPWSGSRWQVTARITTDDGTRLAVVQNLAQGSTRILDLQTSHALTGSELQTRFGIAPATGDDIDVGQLFGLSRGTLRATTFVPQAEVLRVVEQADELQQFLQRAASNQTVDVTAHQVIDRLRDELSTRVGSPTVGQRPLRSATQLLQVAEDHAYRLRTTRDELRQVAVQLRLHAEAEGRAREELTRLEALAGWLELNAIEDRAAKVQAFEAELGTLASVPDPAPAELRERVHAARTAYLTLGEPPTTPEGPTAEELEQQLAELPDAPAGDTSPHPEVRTLWEQLNREVSSLASHDDPEQAGDHDHLPDVASDELRELAGRLRLPRPTWDPADDALESRLRAEHAEATGRYAGELTTWTEASSAHEQSLADYEQARARFDEQVREYETQATAHREAMTAWEASQRTRSALRTEARTSRKAGAWQLVLGVVLLLAGVATLFVEPVAGAALVVVGLALLGWGARARGRTGGAAPSDEAVSEVEQPLSPTPPTPPRPPAAAPPGTRPVEPILSPKVQDVVIRRQRWTEQSAAHDAELAELLSDLRTRRLPTDADELQTLARRVDEREGARRAAEERRASAEQLVATVAETTQLLMKALRDRGEDVSTVTGPESVDEAYRQYERRCQERAAVAGLAARREDLQQALTARRSEELAHHSAVQRQETTRATLLSLVGGLGHDPGGDADSAATVAASWMGGQTRTDEAHQRRARLTSLRDQLLDGSSLHELTARAEDLRGRLGPRPDGVATLDVEQALAAAGREVEAAATRRASTEGRLHSLRTEEQDVAAAIEEAARRRRELSAVQELRTTLELAIEHLEAAQSEAHRSLAPVLESAMRPRIPLVTDGRYRDVRVRPEDLAVELQERTGAWRNAAFLSQGTTEQTYLLLRLALVEHLDTRETMPLVLDDVTVQCDRHRTVALLELLAEISRERQVVLFTQESGVLEWAEGHLDEAAGDRLISLAV